MKSSLLVHKHIIVRQSIYSYKTFALFTRGLFKSCLQSKECLNKPNLLQRKLGKFAKNIRMSFRNSCPRLAIQSLRRVSQMRQKVFVESHRKSKQHKRKLETKSKSQSKQTFLQLDQVNFKEQVVSSFLAVDISLHKLNHPSLKYLFATMGKVRYCLRRLQPGHVLLN